MGLAPVLVTFAADHDAEIRATESECDLIEQTAATRFGYDGSEIGPLGK